MADDGLRNGSARRTTTRSPAWLLMLTAAWLTGCTAPAPDPGGAAVEAGAADDDADFTDGRRDLVGRHARLVWLQDVEHGTDTSGAVRDRSAWWASTASMAAGSG